MSEGLLVNSAVQALSHPHRVLFKERYLVCVVGLVGGVLLCSLVLLRNQGASRGERMEGESGELGRRWYDV